MKISYTSLKRDLNFNKDIIYKKHAPMKKKKPVDKPVPFMNKNLKRAIYKKKCHIISTIDVKINKIGKYTENREIW